MKRRSLLTAATLAIGVAAAPQADAASIGAAGTADAAAYQKAVAKGSIVEMQAFLAAYPTSPYASDVFGRMVQLAGFENSGNPKSAGGPEHPESRGFERSGNPKASGGPDNPGGQY